MAITNVIERAGTVYVYGDRNTVIWTRMVPRGDGNGLKGYTSSTVNIQVNRIITTYDEKGNSKASHSA